MKNRKPVWAIKFKRFCEDNNYSAQEIANILHLSRNSVYTYWSGSNTIPDIAKKTLEKKIGLPIYETFYNEEL